MVIDVIMLAVIAAALSVPAALLAAVMITTHSVARIIRRRSEERLVRCAMAGLDRELEAGLSARPDAQR